MSQQFRMGNNLEGPIYVYTQAWNVARGNGAYNLPYYDPYNEEYTNFPYSGNPETGEGWYAYENNPWLNIRRWCRICFLLRPI
ncbi:MAG: hypothetical protein U5K00_16945 [Melioribacteraceae bacterium]|nr:hypothetical protein [Melioribacteraceae bacterium]